MKRFKDNCKVSRVVFTSTSSRSDEIVTKPNLSYTTGEMFDLWKKGVPINNENNVSQFMDGTKDCTFTIPLTDQRAVDVGDVWEAQQAARSKFRNYKLKSKIKTD